jgi:hypothetical protein
VKNQEALEASAVVGNTANFVQNLIDELLANSVMTAGVVIGCIFLASYQMLGVEETTVGASADFIDDIGLEIAIDSSWDIFALTWRMIWSEMIGVGKGRFCCHLPVSEKKVLKP